MNRIEYKLLSMLGILTFASGTVSVQAQQMSVPERVAALKANVSGSQRALRQYEWIETTVISLKGEEKSRKQERCYYGADGALQKVEVGATPAPVAKRGLRGKIIENKKEELADYMKQAVALVKSYVPPNPARIQAVNDSGKTTVELLQAGARARINFPGYLKPGDNLGVEVNPASNHMVGLAVATYLDDPSAPVTLDVRMADLNDGTSYPSSTTLNAKAKSLQVIVQNSGYRKTN